MTQSLLPQKYTVDVLAQMEKKFTPEELFACCDLRLRDLERRTKESYIEIGLIVYYVEKNNLFSPMYPSLGSWLVSACPYSRSTAYSALSSVKQAMLDGLSLDDCNEIPRCNLKIVNQLSTAVKHDPEILAAAKTETENNFISKVKEKYPSQHLQNVSYMRLKLDLDQRESIDAILEYAMKVLGVNTREQALEFVLLEWKEWRQSQEEE